MVRTGDGAPFHDALLACIAHARLPTVREIEQLAVRIWNDVYRAATGLEWGEAPEGSRERASAFTLARAAFGVGPGYGGALSVA